MKALFHVVTLSLILLSTTASALFFPGGKRRDRKSPSSTAETDTRSSSSSSSSSWTARAKSAFAFSNRRSDMLVDAACIGAGAVTGAVCRYQIGNIVTRKLQEHPRLSYFQGWHTAGINVVGSFVLGTLAGLPTVDPAASHDRRGITARGRLCMGVGFCGSFTTFSTFSVDLATMLGKGEMARALSYMALNNAGGVMAAFAGFNVAKKILSR